MNSEQLAKVYGLTKAEVELRKMQFVVARWRSDFRLFAKDVIKIRGKDGVLQPLILNDAQEMLLNAAEKQLNEDGWVRLIGLKGRRQGFSTVVLALGYWQGSLWDLQNIYILSHEVASTEQLFSIVSLMQANNPFPSEVGTDNAKTLEFINRGSKYSVATSGTKAGGRGRSISFFHGSEVAWWENAHDHFASSVQSVDEVRGEKGIIWRQPENPLPFEQTLKYIEGWVKPPSSIWLESTSAGPKGEFYRRYMDAMRGIGRYRAVFVPWTLQKEYQETGDFIPTKEADEGELSEQEYQEHHKLTDAQMLWRRSKLIELRNADRFNQEYPVTVEEAFSSVDNNDSFIKPIMVMKARREKVEIPDAPLIIGVDPAGAGGDRFAVAYRRGDAIFKIEWRHKLEHDEAVAWLSDILDSWKPERMCIDRGSMGQGIISSLRHMKPRYMKAIKPIDFGGTSKAKQAQPKKSGPVNIRAEIYSRLKDFLAEGGTIPDDDALASDICSARIKFRANNDWLLESKSDMKKRGLNSPDLADACALTFSVVEFFSDWTKPTMSDGFRSGRYHPNYPTELDYGAGSNEGWMG